MEKRTTRKPAAGTTLCRGCHHWTGNPMLDELHSRSCGCMCHNPRAAVVTLLDKPATQLDLFGNAVQARLG